VIRKDVCDNVKLIQVIIENRGFSIEIDCLMRLLNSGGQARIIEVHSYPIYYPSEERGDLISVLLRHKPGERPPELIGKKVNYEI